MVDRRWRLTQPAADDLDSIYDRSVEAWSVDQAERYVLGLERLFGLLADFPGMARLRDEVSPPIRVHPHRSHLVAYREADGGIEVVRILHARQDWRALLG